jgi:hypothetical protein
MLAEIARRAMEGYVRSILQAQGGLAVLRRLAEANIAAIAFKGLASLACLYRDPRQRVIADTDILIHEADLPRAAGILAGMGYRGPAAGDLTRYREFLRRAPGFGGNEELVFQNPRGTSIDLHWRLGSSVDVPALIGRARPATLLGTAFLAVSPQDGLLLCVHHSARNHFSPDLMMRDLLDLELWCAEVLASDQADATWETAAAQGLLAPLLALTGILGRYRPGCAAARLAVRIEPAVSAGERRSAASLRELFDTQLAEGQIERDLLYLFRPSEAKQILAGLCFGGRRHLEMARSMDAAHAGEPVSVWKRLSVIARSLRGVRPRHVRMLRALARTKDAFAGRA